jgi:hypothetical protein
LYRYGEAFNEKRKLTLHLAEAGGEPDHRQVTPDLGGAVHVDSP